MIEIQHQYTIEITENSVGGIKSKAPSGEVKDLQSLRLFNICLSNSIEESEVNTVVGNRSLIQIPMIAIKLN